MNRKELFSKSAETQARQRLVTTKAYGLVSTIALAGALTVAGANTVSADEVTTSVATETVVTTDNPATNLVEVQPATPVENTDLQAHANTNTGAIVTPVETPALDRAVAEAEANGVVVTKGEIAVHDSLEAAQNDTANQEAAVKNAEAEKVENNEEIAAANATNAQIDADNAAEAKRVEEANKQGQEATDQRNKAGQEAVEARNKAGQEAVDKRNQVKLDDIEAEKLAVEERNKAGQAATDQRNKLGQEAVDKRNANALAEWEANKETTIAADAAALAGYNERKKANEEANAKGQAEADAKNVALKAEYDKALKEYNDLLADNDEIQKRNDAAAAVAKAENERLQAEYQKKLADMLAKTKENGYLSEVVAQSLIYKSEPNVTIGTIEGVTKFVNPEKRQEVSDANRNLVHTVSSYSEGDYVGTVDYSNGTTFLLNVGQTATVTYVGDFSASANGEKITKVVARYTAVASEKGASIVTVSKDPAETVIFGSDATQGLVGVGDELHIEKTFYTASGKVVATKENPIIFSISSMNSLGEDGYFEYVKDLSSNMRFVPITGSQVQDHDGKIYASTSIDTIAPYRGHDSIDSPVRYYGSGALVAESGDTFGLTVGASKHQTGHWFAMNTNVAAPTVTPPPPLKEVTPEKLKPVPATPPKLETVTFSPTPFNEEPPAPSKIPNEPTFETFTPEIFTPETYTPTPYTPEVFVPETFTPEVYNPITPVVKPHVPVPEAKTIKTTVHPVAVKDAPAITKDVVNTEGTSINGELVAKNSTETWVLNPGALKAGREAMTSVVLSDPFPAGTKIVKDDTAKLSPEWLVSYDETGKAIVTLSANGLAKVNADLAKDFVLPTFNAVFTVLNDAATYKNAYTMTLTTKSGKTYTATSNTPVIYTPGSETRTYNGNVVVRYFDVDTNVKIAPNQADLEDAKVGTAYDTTDQKQEVIAHEGKLYKLTSKVVGSETGKVTDGTIYVDYFYKVVENEPGKGNVVIHYVNEDEKTVANDVVDSSNVPTGTSYDTTDHKPSKITTEDGIEYELVPEKTIGQETGEVIEGTTEVTYVYKRITPRPETPTPNDSLIEPEKHLYQVGQISGANLDGLQLLPNKTYSYTAVTDNNQYKGLKATQGEIFKGFLPLVDDPQDNTVLFDFSTLKTTLADGRDVSSDFEVRSYESLEKADAEVVAILKAARISPDGYFSVVVPKGLDFEGYFNKYVFTGLNLFHTFDVKTGDYIGDFSNKVWQVDFGNGYAGNTVENNVPKLDGIKKILESIGSNKDLTGGTIELGQTYPARLSFPVVKTTIDGKLKSLYGIENFDENFDEYNGEFYAFASGDMKLKDGSIIKLDEELTRYIVQELIRDEKTGQVVAVKYTVNPEFYDLLAEGEEIKIDVYSMLKRIAYGENIENEWIVYVNDVEVDKDIVTTNTPKPKEETPEVPETPVTPGTPVARAQTLPSTGEESSMAFASLGASMAIAGLGLARRKRDSEVD
ncbi:SspB-related isopeptide-forming adhesin [Streptococcus suis]|uniref:SspB-related isopeptide-forming adhesin n=1 Tax=Streptococcus suis TaxID=1307 RepID=UPI000CF5B7B1|nr:GbpC/Spa domain-containing protein [Streptococcus suis]MBS8025517.1 LPXTG cell wall anchor domain-containing protein [Streptococcus suis]NQJ89192.1 LPXTG cell wall anchor domain-containing protein [Streptococcus suis]NQL59492.1 LPXTG cell wall anchor domain-containing protein [Streptococcus suis]HEM4114143.1 LPXTG cell wall anchor domain-containing protein [Streptococcus suis]HEM5931821.1 LPXTG cell wall anchor domain-containing protein [Streptococcus suis]